MLLESKYIDILLLDIQMPGRNGIVVLNVEDKILVINGPDVESAKEIFENIKANIK